MTERDARRPVWVLTGPIGAGKTLVATVLGALGAHVIGADELGHGLLADPEVVDALVTEFGAGILAEGGIDRGALGARVFADPSALARLNALMHPRLSRGLARALAAAPAEPSLAVVEAAVYFQLPSFGPVDLVVLVDADPEVRIARLCRGGRLDVAEARRRVAAQDVLWEDWRDADVVLRNDGDPGLLREAVESLYARHVRADR